jgi:hypothetical protein
MSTGCKWGTPLHTDADVIRTVLGADEGASATELLLGEASELLSLIAQTDAAACARHVLSREGVSLLLLVMGSPSSGTLARQQVVRLLRHFVSAGSGTDIRAGSLAQ